jgi:hypothetical protein|tara:strand:- start:1902 stop:2366 length:465 start_codon:yes stop_codon:yes gene_type:complete
MTITTLTTQELETKTLEQRVLEWTNAYVNALTENYKQYRINMHSRNILNPRADLSDYAKQQLKGIEDGTEKLMQFRIKSGKKYYKIVQCDFRNGVYQSGSVTAFVDKKTGQVYKPASWKSPAKHVRFDMRIINERNYIHNPINTDWAGGHLYMR